MTRPTHAIRRKMKIMIRLPEFALTRRFAPLFATQFLGAFNDNVFKTALFVMIAFHGLAQGSWLPESQWLNVGALLFVLPYFLFSAWSGQVATRWDKAKLARYTKMLEVAIMTLAGAGFLLQSVWLLMLCLFVMGAQSTLFGPVKYAILPEYLRDKELMMGNGLIESGTFLAILLGQMLGTVIAGSASHMVAGVVLLIAALGLAASAFMPSKPPQNPQQIVERNVIHSTKKLLRDTKKQPELFVAIIGISWFWFIGAVYTTQLPTFVKIHLGGDDAVFNLMLALFSIGIALGSVLCAKCSKGKLNLAWVSVGALGLTVLGTLLVFLTHEKSLSGSLNGLGAFLAQGVSYPIMLLMLGIGFCGGFFSVPLYTWLQTASSDDFRANAIAANNIINAIFMVAAAIISAILLMMFNSIALLYLLVALGNVPVLAYLCVKDKRFLLRGK